MRRPASIPIFGVINIIFAVFGLLGTVNSLLILIGMDSSNPVYVIMQTNRLYRIIMYVSAPLALVFAGLLLAAGVGLLLSKPWGRKISIVYGILGIVIGLVSSIVNAEFLLVPLLEQARQTDDPTVIAALFGAIGGMVGGCIGVIHPILLLFFMTRKNVVEYLKDPSLISGMSEENRQRDEGRGVHHRDTEDTEQRQRRGSFGVVRLDIDGCRLKDPSLIPGIGEGNRQRIV